MDKVQFTQMKDGSKEDYELLHGFEEEFAKGLPDRILSFLKNLDGSLDGYQITRLEHSLQTATRAAKDGADEQMIVAALIHDIGDGLATYNHSQFAASVLRPYVSEKVYWIIKHHGLFQTYYYAHHMGQDRNMRDQYKDFQYYQDTIDFCEKWDQTSFDPNYESYSLNYFEPMVRRVFTKTINNLG
jgi:predicted HD phosphohydrolase|tara:strand:+ start:310 stop:867 length:558 start_codon:yes stop_codon:yes gene_type:complete